MGRFRALVKFFGRPNRLANLGHQRNVAGYVNKSMQYGFSASLRNSLYRLNSNSTGGIVEDDYEVDYTYEAKWEVQQYMRGECANAGQESLVETAIDNMEILLIVYRDFDPTHTAMPDEAPIAHIVLETNHPEAIGLILDGAINRFYEFADEVNQ